MSNNKNTEISEKSSLNDQPHSCSSSSSKSLHKKGLLQVSKPEENKFTIKDAENEFIKLLGLKNRESYQNFREHLDVEHSEENLRFWLQAERYRHAGTKERQADAFRLYEGYISFLSQEQINITEKMRKNILQNLEKCEESLYVEAQDHILCLLRYDPLHRFIQKNLKGNDKTEEK